MADRSLASCRAQRPVARPGPAAEFAPSCYGTVTLVKTRFEYVRVRGLSQRQYERQMSSDVSTRTCASTSYDIFFNL